MKIKITGSDGLGWYAKHVGEEFTVNSVTVQVRPGLPYVNYEVDLIGKRHGSISGTVPDRHCEVMDWTGWPYAEVHT